MLLIPGIIASSGAPQVGDFESIDTITVGAGGAASVSFTSIPSIYQHLQIRATIRSNRAGSEDAVKLQLNSDTGSTYDQHLLYGTGASAVSAGTASQTYIYPVVTTAASDLASTFAVMVADILDYTNTNKNTTVRSLSGYDRNGGGIVILASGLWRNTNAVSTITISPNASNWVEHSHFALYGIRG